jgi:hypothetical protein
MARPCAGVVDEAEDERAAGSAGASLTTSGLNEARVTDVAAVWTAAGWLLLAAILDLYPRRVVGWAPSGSHIGEPSWPQRSLSGRLKQMMMSAHTPVFSP